MIETCFLEERGNVVCEGCAVGGRFGSGNVDMLTSLTVMAFFMQGDAPVTDMTDPHCEPEMCNESAAIAHRGGNTCHAASMAHALCIPATWVVVTPPRS